MSLDTEKELLDIARRVIALKGRRAGIEARGLGTEPPAIILTRNVNGRLHQQKVTVSHSVSDLINDLTVAFIQLEKAA